MYGRIVAVADVFDALSSKRVYHQAWSWDEIFQYFLTQSERHFDPCLVDILLANRDEFMAICNRYHDSEREGPEVLTQPDPFEPGWAIRW